MVTTDRGDVVELLDVYGQPFAAYRYDAWGNPQGSGNVSTGIWSQQTTIPNTQTVVISSSIATDIANRQVLRYAGYCCDSESGLYYLSARSYDPVTRQFLSKDLSRNDGEESAYQYVGGDPVGSTDPTGNKKYVIDYPDDSSSYELNRKDWPLYLDHVLEQNAGYLFIKYAAYLSSSGSKNYAFCSAVEWWYSMVKTNGLWDLKLRTTSLPSNRKYIPFWANTPSGYISISREDFGNINFGFTGKSIGLPLTLLDGGSLAVAFPGIVWPLVGGTDFGKCFANLKNEYLDEGMISRGVTLFGILGRNSCGDYYTWK